VAGCVLVGVAYQWLDEMARKAPHAGKRPNVQRLDPGIGISLKDVSLAHYEGTEKVASAKVGEVEVRRDRRFFTLRDVKDGSLKTETGPLQVSAKEGTWDANSGVLTTRGATRVTNKDMDLKTLEARYQRDAKRLTVPGGIQGRLFGGRANAASLEYNTATRDGSARAIRWSGNLPQEVGDQVPGAKLGWELDGDLAQRRGDITTYTKGRGTDGDIIVRGEKIVHDTKKDIVTITGRVLYFSSAANLVADKAVIYRREKRAVLTGNVRMLIKPKSERESKPKEEEIPPFRPLVPDEVKASRPPAPRAEGQREPLRQPETVREYPMAVTAQQIEYFYRRGERRAIITGGPQARQEMPEDRWRHVWAFRANWDGEAQTLKLFSAEDKIDVRLKNSLGDDLTAKTVTLMVEDDDVRNFDAERLSGLMTTEDEDEVPRPERRTGGGSGSGTTGGG
jgi:lipopolysaccharide export system protein LptA